MFGATGVETLHVKDGCAGVVPGEVVEEFHVTIPQSFSFAQEANDEINPPSAREVRSGKNILISGRCPMLEMISSSWR